MEQAKARADLVGGPPEDACDCICHRGAVVVHPAACCEPCPSCWVAIPAGFTSHTCRDVASQPAQTVPRSGGLVHGVTRYDTTFAGLVAMALMGLCVAGSPGTPLFVGAIAGGGVFAFLLHRARGRKRTSIASDEPDPR
jgi:hypothetical protein